MKSFKNKNNKNKKYGKSGSLTKEQVHQELESLYDSKNEKMSRGAQNLASTLTSAQKDQWRRPINQKSHKAK